MNHPLLSVLLGVELNKTDEPKFRNNLCIFFHCHWLHVHMCFFGCISLVRVFILHVTEFSLSSYRSSKYFLAVDFIILRE